MLKGWLRSASGMVLFLVALGAAAETNSAPPAILVVGDSLSAAYKIPAKAGWVQLLAGRLADDGYDYRVINASIPGDTTAGGVARLPAALARYHPAIIVLELGGNDGLRGLPLEQMQQNLSRMIHLAKQSGARVLLLGVRMPPNYGPVYTERFHAVYRDLARTEDIPLVPELLRGVADDPRLMQFDGLHPTAAAEPTVLANVWPVLAGLLVRPAMGSATSARALLPAAQTP